MRRRAGSARLLWLSVLPAPLCLAACFPSFDAATGGATSASSGGAGLSSSASTGSSAIATGSSSGGAGGACTSSTIQWATDFATFETASNGEAIGTRADVLAVAVVDKLVVVGSRASDAVVFGAYKYTTNDVFLAWFDLDTGVLRGSSLVSDGCAPVVTLDLVTDANESGADAKQLYVGVGNCKTSALVYAVSSSTFLDTMVLPSTSLHCDSTNSTLVRSSLAVLDSQIVLGIESNDGVTCTSASTSQLVPLGAAQPTALVTLDRQTQVAGPSGKLVHLGKVSASNTGTSGAAQIFVTITSDKAATLETYDWPETPGKIIPGAESISLSDLGAPLPAFTNATAERAFVAGDAEDANGVVAPYFRSAIAAEDFALVTDKGKDAAGRVRGLTAGDGSTAIFGGTASSDLEVAGVRLPACAGFCGYFGRVKIGAVAPTTAAVASIGPNAVVTAADIPHRNNGDPPSIIVAGSFSGTASFPCESLTSPGTDGFVARFATASGN